MPPGRNPTTNPAWAGDAPAGELGLVQRPDAANCIAMKPTLSNHDAPASGPNFDTEFLRRHSTSVVIQESATRRYLTPAGLWSNSRDQACTFRSGSAAMEQVKQQKLTQVRLVLTRDITFSEVIPVPNSMLS